jgi:hypothetical protein
MKADDPRNIWLVEMAFHGFAHVGAEFVEGVGLSEDVGADAVGDVPALSGFFNDEQDFRLVGHGV